MLFKSRIDAEDRSTQELIIFCHAHERVLLPLPKTYEVRSTVLRIKIYVFPGIFRLRMSVSAHDRHSTAPSSLH
ncbi:hypothetical protein BD309DRAFT_663960 [Dichomitus squalens]|nr:hypothetical protein BD309DRAFT_663960 [Dichomitus squalens]